MTKTLKDQMRDLVKEADSELSLIGSLLNRANGHEAQDVADITMAEDAQRKARAAIMRLQNLLGV